MNLLRPSLRDFSFLDCYRRAHLLRQEAARLRGGSRVLLDLGGRGRPYAPLFEGRVSRQYVLDLEAADTVDVAGDARQMPIADAAVDVVLCTQVLEHVSEPATVVHEILRILKPGGTLLLTVPGIFPQHGSPGDYWRYMPQGIAWLLRDFTRVEVKPEAGTAASALLVFNMYLFMFSAGSSACRRLLSWTICPITNSLGLLAGKFHRGKQFASNYLAVAVR